MAFRNGMRPVHELRRQIIPLRHALQPLREVALAETTDLRPCDSAPQEHLIVAPIPSS